MQELSLAVQAQINYHLSTAQPCFKAYLFVVSKGRGGGVWLMLFVIVLVFPMYNSMVLTLRG